MTGGKQQKCCRRSDQRSGGIKCLVKPECLAQIVSLD